MSQELPQKSGPDLEYMQFVQGMGQQIGDAFSYCVDPLKDLLFKAGKSLGGAFSGSHGVVGAMFSNIFSGGDGFINAGHGPQEIITQSPKSHNSAETGQGADNNIIQLQHARDLIASAAASLSEPIKSLAKEVTSMGFPLHDAHESQLCRDCNSGVSANITQNRAAGRAT